MAEDPAQLEHVFHAVVLASFADGQPSADELRVLQKLMTQHPAITQPLPALVNGTYRLIKELGGEGLLERIVAGLHEREYQEMAFAYASQIIGADGHTHGGEAMMLGELQERFGFSPADVLRLLA